MKVIKNSIYNKVSNIKIIMINNIIIIKNYLTIILLKLNTHKLVYSNINSIILLANLLYYLIHSFISLYLYIQLHHNYINNLIHYISYSTNLSFIIKHTLFKSIIFYFLYPKTNIHYYTRNINQLISIYILRLITVI